MRIFPLVQSTNTFSPSLQVLCVIPPIFSTGQGRDERENERGGGMEGRVTNKAVGGVSDNASFRIKPCLSLIRIVRVLT